MKTGIWKFIAYLKRYEGEGPFAGTPAIFVRLAGCNLQCPGCDTDYTSQRLKMSPIGALSLIETFKGYSLIVITGGEPFRQNLGPLVSELRHANYQVQIETNGTIYDNNFLYDLATIVCSPKTASIHKNMHSVIDAYKYVLQAGHISKEDGLPESVFEQQCACSSS